MGRLKVFCLMLFALLVVGGGFAGSAVALPSILLLPEDAGKSLLLSSLTNTSVTRLETSAGLLTGAGVKVKLHFPNAATNLGLIEVTFTEVEKAETGKCKTATATVEGEVIVPKTSFHLVFDSLTLLGVAALILVPEFSATCGAEATVSFKGNVLSLISPISKEILVSEELGSSTRCSATRGIPVDTSYWNGAGEKGKALLLGKLGLAFEEACQNIAATVQLKGNIMAEIMG